MTFTLRLINVAVVSAILIALGLIPSLATVREERSDGTSRITGAGGACLILAGLALTLTIGQAIWKEKDKKKEEEAAAFERERTTREIVLSGQPLRTIELRLRFHGVRRELLEAFEENRRAEAEHLGKVSYSTRLEHEFAPSYHRKYVVHPLMEMMLSNRPVKLASGHITVFSIDDSDSFVLPFGDLAQWGRDETERSIALDIAAGVQLRGDVTCENADGVRTRRNSGDMRAKSDGNDVELLWRLRSIDLADCIDKASESTAITAAIPRRVRIVSLDSEPDDHSRETMANLSDVPNRPWEPNMPPLYDGDGEPDAFKSCTLTLIYNNRPEVAANYSIRELGSFKTDQNKHPWWLTAYATILEGMRTDA